MRLYKGQIFAYLLVGVFTSFLVCKEAFDGIVFLPISHFEHNRDVSIDHNGTSVGIKHRAKIGQLGEVGFSIEYCFLIF